MHVIYGGTFDPVHHGHLRLAVELRERLAIDAVSLMPCHIPPHRDNPGASSEARLKLLALAIADEPGLSLDDRELGRDGASFTAETLRQVRAELGPDEPLAMVVGTDAFSGFHRWEDWQKIPGLAHIIVVNRPGYELDPDGPPGQLLQQRRATGPHQLKNAPCGLICSMNIPWLDISATAVRAAIAEGRSPRYWVPESVWAAVRKDGLYGYR